MRQTLLGTGMQRQGSSAKRRRAGYCWRNTALTQANVGAWWYVSGVVVTHGFRATA